MIRTGPTICRSGLALVLAFVVGAAIIPSSADDSSGRKWTARYDKDDGDDWGDAVAVSPNGARVFVTGWSDGRDARLEILTVAYSAKTGRRNWVARYEADPGYAGRTELGVSRDGAKVFVTGYARARDNTQRYVTIAYAARTGRRLWSARLPYDPCGDDCIDESMSAALAVSPKGKYLFVTVSSDNRVVTTAYRTSRGERAWSARHGKFWSLEKVAVAVSPDGSRVVAIGSNRHGDGSDIAIYSASTGRRRWVTASSGTSHVAFAPNGRHFYVTGEYDYGGVYTTTAHRASTGDQVWDADWGEAGFASASLAISPDGSRLFVSGEVSGSDDGRYDYDFATVAYSARSGAELWVARYDDPLHGDGIGRTVAVTPDGSRVYVAGENRHGESADLLIVAYDAATGEHVWHDLDTSSKGGDFASIAVAPDGSTVFVTGSIGESGDDYDVITIAYDSAAVSLPPPTCDFGASESGPISAPVHEQIEPRAVSGRSTVHLVSCIVAGAGG